MGALASLGAAALPFLKMIPGIGPRLQMAAYGLLALMVSHAAVAGWVWFRMHEANAVALAMRDAEWSDTLKKAKDENDRKVEEARRAGEAEHPTPADAAERLQLCRKSPTCRDRGRQ